jgi:hypothetical protein
MAKEALRSPGRGSLGNSCKVFLMSPLRRKLVLEIGAAPIDYDETGRTGHIAGLIIDEVRLNAQPLHVPMPRDKRLRTACAALLHEPGRPETRRVAGHRRRQQSHIGAVVCERDGDAFCRPAASSLARRRVGAVGAGVGCRLGAPQSRLCERQRFLHSNVSRGPRQRPRAINSLIQPLEP